MFDTEEAKKQIELARYNLLRGWHFLDTNIILDGYEKAIKRIKKLEELNIALLKRAESAEQDWQLAEQQVKKLIYDHEKIMENLKIVQEE